MATPVGEGSLLRDGIICCARQLNTFNTYYAFLGDMRPYSRSQSNIALSAADERTGELFVGLGSVGLLLTQVGFVIDPSSADAKVRTHNYQQAPNSNTIENTRVQPRDSESFVDESTGIEVSISYPASLGSLKYPSSDKDEVLDAKLIVLEDDEALHKAGKCAACDKLRELYESGKASALYYAELKSNYADRSGVKYSISMPSKGVSKPKIYVCDGGTLDTLTPNVKDGHISFSAGRSAIFAVVDMNDTSSASNNAEAKRKNVVVYDDDDDDEAGQALEDDGDDESDGRDAMLDVLSSILIVIVFLTLIIALICLCIKDMRVAFFSRLKASISSLMSDEKDTVLRCACIVFWCVIIVFAFPPLYQCLTCMSTATIWVFIAVPYLAGMMIDALLLAGALASWSPAYQSEE